VVERRGTDSYKYDMLDPVFGRSDILPMWVADMDFQSPPEVVAAVAECAARGVYGYTFRSREASQAFVRWVGEQHRWTIAREWMLASPGVVTALALGVRVLTEPGDKVLVQTPVYPPFMSVVKENGRELVTTELVAGDGRYTIDWDDFERKVAGGVKLFILCNPHNPVGRQWTADELRRMGDICLRNGVTILSDEIHCDLALPDHTHTVLASLSDELAAVTVTLMAPSKTFNIAGTMNSVVVASDPAVRGKLAAELNALHINGGNIFGHVAFKAAYEHGAAWRDELRHYLAANVEAARDFIATEMPDVVMYRPEASFLVWLDFRKLGMPHSEVADRLVNIGKVGLNDGRTFGPGGEGFMRLNVGCPRSVLDDGLRRIKTAFEL
ncbi:PatB family C-S lyase, partial [Alistipes sp. OttesenSCG-928-B03]|nr:PatB family C-S lyase [Alistipes sp. OttesenSCG-928-B03]